MSVPLIELHIKHIIDFTLSTFLSDPVRYSKEVFGDVMLSPHENLFGNKFLKDVQTWIKTTKIPVVRGYDLDPAQIPGVSVNLISSVPYQPYLGDVSLPCAIDREPYQRDVVIPAFAPKLLTPSEDGTYIKIELPDDLEHPDFFTPGLVVRDKNGFEYGISLDDDSNPIIISNGSAELKNGNFSLIEVISPYKDQIVTQGAMSYEENVLVTVHGHADRVEGIWLWAIVHWGLLKYRPLLISLFGLDLAMPSASDFRKADEFLGENIWRRFITLSTKVVWSWEVARQQDYLNFVLSIRNCS